MFITMTIHGQVSINRDTFKISEVIIKGRNEEMLLSGYKSTIIDSSLIVINNNQSISDLISENTSIYIKSYGPGGIATSSFRGSSAGHTMITWNNVNLNNPMPGQFDLSLVPAGLIDKLQIYYGSSSMEVNNGGLGGAINLETGPDWSGKNQLYVNPRTGSFGSYSGLIKVITGSHIINSSTKAYFNMSENNFRYLNTASSSEPYWERRENNQLMQKGFIQEIYLRNSEKGLFSGRFWYQSSDRNMPVPITSNVLYPPEKQYDESLRTMIDYSHENGNLKYKFTGVLLSDKLHYLNKTARIDSKNHSRSIILKTEMNARLGSKTKLKVDIADEMNFVNSNNYTSLCRRNIVTAGLLSEIEITPRLITTTIFREMVVDDKLNAPDFSVSGEYRLIPSQNYFLKASFAHNSRIPTLNDRYWSPGGNPDLKIENSYMTEVSLEMDRNLSTFLNFKSEVTLFRNSLNNLIQWMPGDYSYWVAKNAGKALTSGIESIMSLSYSSSKINLLIKADYTFNRAVSANSFNSVENEKLKKNQLIYVPANKLNTMLKVKWEQFYSTFSSNIVSKRYITPDNSQYLPGYTISNLDFGMLLTKRITSYDFIFSVDNVFNSNYQNIAWYPMPGRSFSLSIIFKLSK